MKANGEGQPRSWGQRWDKSAVLSLASGAPQTPPRSSRMGGAITDSKCFRDWVWSLLGPCFPFYILVYTVTTQPQPKGLRWVVGDGCPLGTQALSEGQHLMVPSGPRASSDKQYQRWPIVPVCCALPLGTGNAACILCLKYLIVPTYIFQRNPLCRLTGCWHFVGRVLEHLSVHSSINMDGFTNKEVILIGVVYRFATHEMEFKRTPKTLMNCKDSRMAFYNELNYCNFAPYMLFHHLLSSF